MTNQSETRRINASSKLVTQGAQNLLLNCVGVNAGERVLLVDEHPNNHFYCSTLSTILSEQIRVLGAEPCCVTAKLIADPVDFPSHVIREMAQADHTIFLNRIGDYARFSALPGNCSKTICYALDAEAMASPFAATPHGLMSELLKKLEAELNQAESWRITCQLGTDIAGTFCWPSTSGGQDDEFSMSTFPVTTFKPVPCVTANGKVAISRWLMPGAAAKVQPGTLRFDEVVMMEVHNGMITGISGSSANSVTEHYDRISSTLGVNRNRVHSWHAGINPHTFYKGMIENNLERWGAISFGSPRYLHFHTCGDIPPGEISWSVFNPTVMIDGDIFWNNGEFVWMRNQINENLINRYPAAKNLLCKSADIGF